MYISDVSGSGYRMTILKVVTETDTRGSKGLSMKIFDLDGKRKNTADDKVFSISDAWVDGR